MEFDIKPDPEGISVKPMTRTLLVPENVINLQFTERWPALISSDTNCSSSLSAVEHASGWSHPRKHTWADRGSLQQTFNFRLQFKPKPPSAAWRRGEAEVCRRTSETKILCGRTSSTHLHKRQDWGRALWISRNWIWRLDKISPIIDTLNTAALAGSWSCTYT